MCAPEPHIGPPLSVGGGGGVGRGIRHNVVTGSVASQRFKHRLLWVYYLFTLSQGKTRVADELLLQAAPLHVCMLWVKQWNIVSLTESCFSLCACSCRFASFSLSPILRDHPSTSLLFLAAVCFCTSSILAVFLASTSYT